MYTITVDGIKYKQQHSYYMAINQAKAYVGQLRTFSEILVTDNDGDIVYTITRQCDINGLNYNVSYKFM